MFKAFLGKLKESFIVVAPISLATIIIALALKLDSLTIYSFLICVVFLILGIALFTKGADTAMFSMGESVGSKLSKTKKVWLILLCGFCIGLIVTFAEPDLAILASQIGSVNKWVFISIVSLGVGVMLLLAVLRIVYNLNLRILFILSFGVVLLLLFFVPSQFIPIAFDSSSATTGSLSVPFVLAFGFGLSAVRSGKNTEEGTFGMIGLSSIGPIISVMLLSLFLPKNAPVTTTDLNSGFSSFADIGVTIGKTLLENMRDVAITLLPILAFFFIFQFASIRLPKSRISKIIVGVIYTYFGIVIFFTGASVGLIPMGTQLGKLLAELNSDWLLIILGAVLGFCVVIAEPAVIILNKNVEKITFGAIKKERLMISLAVGVSLASALSVIRVLYNINFLYIIVPMYILALIMMFFTKEKFVSIAFDSGGVASGTMSVSFILPFIVGIAQAIGADSLTGAFGSIALVAVAPILIVELMGVIYTIASKRHIKRMEILNKKMQSVVDNNNSIINFRH